MALDIILAPAAVEDFRRYDRPMRATLKAAIDQYLTYQPGKVSKSRIKRLRGLRKPQYRLRVGEIRVFYDVNADEGRVEVLRIVSKEEADQVLKEEGINDEDPATDPGEG